VTGSVANPAKYPTGIRAFFSGVKTDGARRRALIFI